MGYHSYKVSNELDYECLFIAPYYSNNILDSNNKHSTKLFRFLNEPRPRQTSLIKKILYFIRRGYFILEFSIKSIICIFQYKPNIIHIHSPMFSLIALFAFLLKKKVYITFHGEDFTKIKDSSTYKYFAFIYTDVFVLSPHMKPCLDLIHGAEKVHIAFNGIDTRVFHDMKVKRNNDFIAVGYLKKVKGFDLLIKAFKILCDNTPYNGVLKIAGSGKELDALRNLVASLQLENRIKFLGELKNNQIIRLYNDNNFFVLSSLSEGFPKVILEAMSCGNIIVSTNVGSVPDVLKDYPYLCKPNDVNGLYEAMKLALTSNNEKLHLKLKERVEQFSWQNAANIYKKIYEKN